MNDNDFIPANPEMAPRLAPAWAAARKLLEDGSWHKADELRDKMLAASDILPGTCVGLLLKGYRHGLLDRRGPRLRRSYRQRV